MTGNSKGYYEYLPQGYSNGQSFPLIIFLEGVGELGDGSPAQLPKLLANGPLFYINAGQFPSSFTVNGSTSSFVIITPQFGAWPGANDVNDVISYAVKNYKVDPSRIYLTGISMGGGVAWDYASNNPTYAGRIAALIPFCGASYPNTTTARTIANSNLPVWAFHNLYDPEVGVGSTQEWIREINTAPLPSPLAKATIFNASGHDAWSQAYYGSYSENNMNIYQWMLQYKRNSPTTTTTPPPTPAPTPTPTPTPTPVPAPASYVTLPAKIEAESWAAMSGVQTENTADAGAGLDVDYIDPSDWMDYGINAPAAGTYTVQLRVASPSSSAQLQLRKADGTVLATVPIPNTGGYQSWQTVTATLTLAQGQQTLRIVSTSPQWNPWNINWINIASNATVPPTTPPVSTGASFKIEAESWSAMSGVQTENTADAGGGLDVDYIDPTDWMDYAVNAPAAGTYTVQLRVASPASSAQLQLRKPDGTVLATVPIPNTGGYQNWQTVTATVTLAQGQQTLRVVSTSPQWNSWNINWLNFTATTLTPAPTTTTFRVEAENWVAMSGVQTENTADAGGGLDVDYIDPTDWMDYSVNAATAGSYTVKFRVASPASSAQLQLRKPDGTVLATVPIPNTGGYQNWQTVSATVTLAQGQQTLRVVSTSPQWNSWNINYMDFSSGTVASATALATSAASFSISPNPVTDKFILQVDNALTGNMEVQILDATGAIKKDFSVLKTSAGATQTYLSIGDLAAGNYTIQVLMTGYKASQPLTKQ